jgi:hypothetical protein
MLGIEELLASISSVHLARLRRCPGGLAGG